MTEAPGEDLVSRNPGGESTMELPPEEKKTEKSTAATFPEEAVMLENPPATAVGTEDSLPGQNGGQPAGIERRTGLC